VTITSLKTTGYLPRPPHAAGISPSSDSAGDRILLTLLALSLMLLAFFVVLTSAGTLDRTRARDVVLSVQATFERPRDETVVQDTAIDGAHRAAVGILRAALASIFADVIASSPSSPAPMDAEGRRRVDPDRVEIDVPMAVFFNTEAAELNPLPLLDNIVAVVATPPSGYRMELVVHASVAPSKGETARARISTLADGLAQRGLSPTMLSVGILEDANASEQSAGAVRFTFLLLDGENDHVAARMMRGGSVP